jgi:hypothetical protein
MMEIQLQPKCADLSTTFEYKKTGIGSTGTWYCAASECALVTTNESNLKSCQQLVFPAHL